MARRIGVVEEPSLPVALFAMIAMAALLAGNVAAVLPARRASRVHPATLLRTD